MVCNNLLTVHILQLCQRLSDNKCWTFKPRTDADDFHFDSVQLYESHYPAWSQKQRKQLALDRVAFKFHGNEYTHALPDLEESTSVNVESVKKEADEDFQYFQPAVKQFTIPASKLSVHSRLVSKRYVFLQDFPASHAALKPFCGPIVFQDNSNATYIGYFCNWKNAIIDVSCSTHCLTLPTLLRQLTSNDCGISDQALKQSIRMLVTFNNTCHLYALYSAMKALAAFHPRSSQAVNCYILDKLPEKRSCDLENVRVCLVLDYIISCVEYELLHYPMVRHHIREFSKLLDIDSPLVSSLMHATENNCSDMKTVALLQRAVNAVGMSDKWLFIDRLASELYQLYRHIRCVRERQRLLASVATPQLRLKLIECILSARCCSYVRRPSKLFLTIDRVRALSSLLCEWLQSSSSSTAVGNSADQIEEYLAVVLTYVESNLHIHKGLLLNVGSIKHDVFNSAYKCDR